MIRLYLGKGVERESFEKYFEPYIKKNLVKKNFSMVTMIWDYDVKYLKLQKYHFIFLELNFINMRKLENGELNIKSDIVFIKEFYRIPFKLQIEIINNIKEGKFNNMIIFFDKKVNIDKYDSDLLDEMTHINVKAK